MAPNALGWWTDDKVDATVTSQYVHSHLRPNEAEQLTKSVFGDLSDDTYLEWILTRSKRFFLALVEAGVPDQIFGIIDDSWDDEDLPIPEDEVPGLLLSAEPDKTLDRRFYRAQFKYLIRIVGDGEHIRYAQEETIPVNPTGLKPILGKNKDLLEKVKLPSHTRRVFARKRIKLTTRGMEEELLAEMAEWRTFAHEHVLSIFGSYTTEDNLFVLMTPAPEYSLKSFLNDVPKAFDTLPKSDRRRIVLQWAHCLANGLSWLHENGKHHGAIRPSRILIDEEFRVYLGQFDGLGILCDNTVKDDIEAYQYAAPERWKRSVQIQATGSARTVLPSGGRSARKAVTDADRSSSSDEHLYNSTTQLDIARPTSVSYVFSPTSKNGTRLKLGSTRNAASRLSSTLRRTESRQDARVATGLRPIRSSLENHARHGAASPISPISSNSNETTIPRRQAGPIYAATPEMRTAVVQTWTSAQHDQLAADIFSIGSIMMDIFTFLCKHSYSSFARHRATKNKSAGRGGGLADASFHANIGQVFSWAEMLQKDAEKRIKKDEGTVFKAVGPCLQVILQCLDREPSERLHADELQRKLCEHVRDFAGVDLPQCCLDGEVERSDERPQTRAASMEMLRNKASSRQQLLRRESRAKSRSDTRQMETTAGPVFSPRIDSLKISPANFNTFDFDIDNTTATLVNSEQPGRKQHHRPDSFALGTEDGIEAFPRPPTSTSTVTSKRRQPPSDAGASSLAVSPLSGVPRHFLQGDNNHHLSGTASTTGASEDFQSVYSYTPPPSAHPTRELPPIPGSTSSIPSTGQTRTNTTLRSLQASINESDSEPTALPALPTISKSNISHLRGTSSSGQTRRHQQQQQHGRSASSSVTSATRADDPDEITPVADSSNQRHYRSSSRTGMHEGRLYVSHVGRDKLALRGLQYP